MQKIPVNNFTVIESVYGKFIVNRHCAMQAEHLIKLGVPHIEPELKVILGIVATLPDNCVVVDAGANIGLVSIPVAQSIKARGGKVCAFEIQRMLFNALCGAVALNDLENLYVSPKGLGAKKGSAKIKIANYAQPQDFGLFSLVQPEKIIPRDDVPDEKIDIARIDDLALPRLDFLKIDVEGMEIDVLIGARKMLETYRPWCWVEYWKVKIEDIKAQFAGLPYKFYLIDQLNMLCAPADRVETSRTTVTAQEV